MENAQNEQSSLTVIGQLTDEEKSKLGELKNQSAAMVQKVGEHEVLKLRLVGRIEDLESQGQELLASISRRLDLEPGTQWVATPDGGVVLVNNQ
jgi:hypothetical protein